MGDTKPQVIILDSLEDLEKLELDFADTRTRTACPPRNCPAFVPTWVSGEELEASQIVLNEIMPIVFRLRKKRNAVAATLLSPVRRTPVRRRSLHHHKTHNPAAHFHRRGGPSGPPKPAPPLRALAPEALHASPHPILMHASALPLPPPLAHPFTNSLQ